MLNYYFSDTRKGRCSFLRSSIYLLILLFISMAQENLAKAGEYKNVIIKKSANCSEVESRITQLLADRLQEAGISSVSIGDASLPVGSIPGQLTILLGRAETCKNLKGWMDRLRILPLSLLEPGAEGFLLKMVNDQNLLLAAGVDQRGCLYAVGEILRQSYIRNGQLQIPDELEIRTAPAFEIRGTQVGQSGVAKTVAKVRDWTEAEKQRVILDYALAGANIFSTDFGPQYDFLRSYGLMTQGEFGANTAKGAIPKSWEAQESIGRTGYVCLSEVEGKAYMLKLCDDYFKNRPAFDLVKFWGGDGGGCECDRCKPYGLTFIKTVEKMADIIHHYHPETRIYFTNQKFDNADDQAIFAYLQETPRDWLWAWGYGPGSDATSWQPGHRQTHRMDLFDYPGYAPYSLYPKEILHQLPPQQKLLYYNEMTHWKYAQHAFIQMYPRADRDGNLPPHWSHDIYERRPDQFLTMVYNRLTFYACPRNYFRVFNDLMPFGIGDITHSSGHHDHFNQWMWQRLMWSPRRTLDEVVMEYCQTWFGHEAAPEMAKALMQLEDNLEEKPGEPLPQKNGIQRYYDLVKRAGASMPGEIMEKDWLWRMHMQKAALDRYVQLSVTQQMELQLRIEQHMEAAIHQREPLKAISEALGWFDLKESKEMTRLREEAFKLGEESNRIFGERNDGMFNLQHDFIGLGWLKRQLERALKAKGNTRKELLMQITDYECKKSGGIYDNLGTANHAPHVVNGYPYDHGQPYVTQMLSEGNRPSQRSMHFTQNEKQGVTLHYTDLDPKCKYKIRFTFVRPWYQERYAGRMNQTRQNIYANDYLLAKDVELPLQMSDFFTYDIPSKVIHDGELTIRLEKDPQVAVGERVAVEQWRNSGGWGTIASEVWLLKE